MTIYKTGFAALASAGLIVAQPAAAAVSDRSGTPTSESRELAGHSGALPFLIALLVAAVVVIVDASNDDDPEIPVSP